MIASAGAYTLVFLVFVVATGFGLYPAGPWRLVALGLAALVATGMAARALAGRATLSPWRPEWALTLLALVAVHGSWGWARDGDMLLQLRVALAVVAAGVVLRRTWGSDREVRFAWPLLLAIAAALYLSIPVQVPEPGIDVYDHMVRGADALLSGENPYAQAIPDYYGGRVPYGFDAPGFPYPPLVLLLSAATHAVGLDIRFALIGCILAGAAIVRRIAMRQGSSRETADLLGLLYLFFPRLSFAVASAHSEPLSGLLFVAGIHCLVSARRTAGFALLGLFAGSKQYLVVALPLLLLAARTPRSAAALALGALLPWLPFAVWNAPALFEATVRVHATRPVRRDSLTLNTWLLVRGSTPLPRWLPILSGALVGIASGARPGLGAPALSVAIAGCLVVTFLTSPQAFANYYVLTAWILVAGLAAVPNTSPISPADPRSAG